MFKKKFFQKYTLNSVEEVLVVASIYVDTLGDWADMLFANLFTREEWVGKDKVDLSNCFLITKEVEDALSDLVDKYHLMANLLSNEYPDLDAHKALDILKGVKSKMLDGNTLRNAIIKDEETFGDAVSFYSNCPFISVLKLVDLLG